MELCLFSGISMMEDAMDFYKPLKEWIDQHLKSKKELVIEFELNYFNSSSAKQFIQLISILEDDQYHGKVIWKYPMIMLTCMIEEKSLKLY